MSLQTTRRNNQIEFENLMTFANDLARTEPKALIEYIRLLVRPLQSEMMLDPAAKGKRSDSHSIDVRNFFWDGQCQQFDQLKRTRRRRGDIEVRLDRDPILPWPWERNRLVNSLTSIGPSRKWGKWKVDDMNHQVTLWLPWGLAFVGGGNHSITAGIIGAAGKIRPSEVYDMSGIFRLIECDGLNYKNKIGFGDVAPALDPRSAAIFETGRLMRKHGVSAW